MLHAKLKLPAGYTYQWSGEYEFELRARERLKLILPVVFLAIFMLLYMVFHSAIEALMLIFPHALCHDRRPAAPWRPGS
jgi:Cu(I)/Ag(I) efflux system membrane protein CusA/SilA